MHFNPVSTAVEVDLRDVVSWQLWCNIAIHRMKSVRHFRSSIMDVRVVHVICYLHDLDIERCKIRSRDHFVLRSQLAQGSSVNSHEGENL
jgi:hypothetical protein